MQYIQYTLSWFNPFSWIKWYNNKKIIQKFIENLDSKKELNISSAEDIKEGIEKQDINMLLSSVSYLLDILGTDTVDNFNRHLINMSADERAYFLNTEKDIEYKNYIRYSTAVKYLRNTRDLPQILEKFYKQKNEFINNSIATTILSIAAAAYTIISAFVFFSPILLMLSIGFFMLSAISIALTKSSYSEYQNAKSHLIEAINVITTKQNINDLNQECIINVCREISEKINNMYLELEVLIKNIPNITANSLKQKKACVEIMVEKPIDQKSPQKKEILFAQHNIKTNSSFNSYKDRNCELTPNKDHKQILRISSTNAQKMYCNKHAHIKRT